MATFTLLRERKTGHEAKVSNAELFFDLVYVFAITQLSHHLLGHLSLLGAAQTLLLWFAVWLGWQYTCWITNWFDPEKLPIRILLFALMLLALPMAAAIPEAFGERGLVFAGCFTGIQVGRTLFVLYCLGRKDPLTPNFSRILGWTVISGCFWIAGALQEEGMARMALWAIAVACEYFAPMFGFALPGLGRSSTREWTIEGGHLAERCQLCMIVALGESVLVTGASLSEASAWGGEIAWAFGLAFVISLAIWWIYFDTGSRDASHTIAHAADPGGMGALFHYLHVIIVGSVIVVAVGCELLIAHPHDAAGAKQLATLAGGPALYLLGNALFRRVVYGALPGSHWAGVIGLAALAAAASALGWTVLAVGAAVVALLLAVAVWDGCTQRHLAH